jgi:hypothetical protein
MPPGKYVTKAGSTMVICGKHGGISEVEFDWLEEDGQCNGHSCLDCVVNAYDDEGFLKMAS